jgi:hypothetical protein
MFLLYYVSKLHFFNTALPCFVYSYLSLKQFLLQCQTLHPSQIDHSLRHCKKFKNLIIPGQGEFG